MAASFPFPSHRRDASTGRKPVVDHPLTGYGSNTDSIGAIFTISSTMR